MKKTLTILMLSTLFLNTAFTPPDSNWEFSPEEIEAMILEIQELRQKVGKTEQDNHRLKELLEESREQCRILTRRADYLDRAITARLNLHKKYRLSMLISQQKSEEEIDQLKELISKNDIEKRKLKKELAIVKAVNKELNMEGLEDEVIAIEQEFEKQELKHYIAFLSEHLIHTKTEFFIQQNRGNWVNPEDNEGLHLSQRCEQVMVKTAYLTAPYELEKELAWAEVRVFKGTSDEINLSKGNPICKERFPLMPTDHSNLAINTVSHTNTPSQFRPEAFRAGSLYSNNVILELKNKSSIDLEKGDYCYQIIIDGKYQVVGNFSLKNHVKEKKEESTAPKKTISLYSGEWEE